MKATVLVCVLVLFSGCTLDDYHLSMMSESFRGSTQAEHLNQLRTHEPRPEQLSRVCVYYPMGLGGYSAGCKDEPRS